MMEPWICNNCLKPILYPPGLAYHLVGLCMEDKMEKDAMQPRNEFKVHILNDDGIQKAKWLANTFTQFFNDIEELCGSDGREMAIVRTKLEEASFFAKKAMASRPENQK